jgi:hypothetical protein
MKITTWFIIGLTLGAVAAVAEDKIFKDSEESYYVAMKFAKTGKLLQLSNKFDDHYNCLNSDDFIIHSAMAKESGSQIVCTNQKIDYKL